MPHFLRSHAFLIANASRSRAFAAFAKHLASKASTALTAQMWWSVFGGVFMAFIFRRPQLVIQEVTP